MGVPLWGWLLGGAVAVVWLTRLAMHRNRARIENEFVAHLQQHHPALSWVRQEGKTMVLRHERVGELRFHMHKLYITALRLPPGDVAGRKQVYEQTARALLEQAEPAKPDPAKLRPRLVPAGALEGVAGIPSRALEPLGLRVTYVLAGAAGTRSVTDAIATELGLDEAGLYARAVANLADSVPAQLVRCALAEKAMNVVKTGDGHDAARLLALPVHLSEGEEIAVLIPDANTLVVVAPPGGDYASLAKLAKSTDGSAPMFGGVIRVTREGFFRAT